MRQCPVLKDRLLWFRAIMASISYGNFFFFGTESGTLITGNFRIRLNILQLEDKSEPCNSNDESSLELGRRAVGGKQRLPGPECACSGAGMEGKSMRSNAIWDEFSELLCSLLLRKQCAMQL